MHVHNMNAPQFGKKNKLKTAGTVAGVLAVGTAATGIQSVKNYLLHQTIGGETRSTIYNPSTGKPVQFIWNPSHWASKGIDVIGFGLLLVCGWKILRKQKSPPVASTTSATP